MNPDNHAVNNLVRRVGPTARAVALHGALNASPARRAAARGEERRRRCDLHDELGPRSLA